MALSRQAIAGLFPHSQTLTDEEFDVRHQAVVIIAWLHVPGVGVVARVSGASALASLVGAAGVAVIAAAAWRVPGRRRVRALLGTAAVLSSSMMIFDLTGAAPHAFVHALLVVPLLMLYQDWLPVAVSVATVFAHHRVVAALDPEVIERGLVGGADPWSWVIVHTTVVGVLGVVCLAGLGANAGALRRRDEAEAGLRDELARAASVVEASPDGVVVIDTDGRVVTTNERAVVMWRIPRRLLATKDARQVLSSAAGLAADPNELLRGLRELRDPGGPERRDEIELRDGRVYERVSEPHRVEGRVVGRVWTFRDVSALKRTAADLQEAVGRLRARDESRELFLTAVSHDMRTPLQALTGFAQLLRDRGEDLAPEERAEFIGIVHEKAQRMEQLVSNLLDLDRLARGTLEPQRDSVDIATLIDRVVANVDVGDRTLKVDTESVHARVDGPMIERVVENLLVNAAKHTPEDVEVRIRLRANGDDVLFAVDDRGPGVPDELKERVFQPFVRGDRDEASPGSGIGLSIVARFVELHEGKVWVEDRPGGGSSFKVQIPGVVPDPAPAPGAARAKRG